jgi:hypothetical protein
VKINSNKGLITIGEISPYAYKIKGKELVDKNRFLTIPYSFLAMLVGFIDGDGYICITKTKKKYIKLCLVISLDIKDLSVLKYIESILNIGKINIYPKSGEKRTCKLVIHKTELQDILFPLLVYHNIFFLTNIRSTQYNKAIYILQNNIKYYYDIPKVIPIGINDINKKNSEDITSLAFFNN